MPEMCVFKLNSLDFQRKYWQKHYQVTIVFPWNENLIGIIFLTTSFSTAAPRLELRSHLNGSILLKKKFSWLFYYLDKSFNLFWGFLYYLVKQFDSKMKLSIQQFDSTFFKVGQHFQFFTKQMGTSWTR